MVINDLYIYNKLIFVYRFISRNIEFGIVTKISCMTHVLAAGMCVGLCEREQVSERDRESETLKTGASISSILIS